MSRLARDMTAKTGTVPRVLALRGTVPAFAPTPVPSPAATARSSCPLTAKKNNSAPCLTPAGFGLSSRPMAAVYPKRP